ncbi:hypothetical protein KP509_21G003900 [Ceratopteris richardii]|uniref:RING-type E3 ubiquitin transferase n=1 Tax=Ceratopteris richardii TaxID=49495 RepID=A0A8T2S781_CERRI|nr:hypothetical protein KP509_21G003900 [Ceratopteris richardii]
MYDLLKSPRRLLVKQLQETTASILASSPVSPDDEDQNQQGGNAFDFNTRFSPSMTLILVVLLTAFFFMAFFSIYVKRCSTTSEGDVRRSRRPGEGGDIQPGVLEPPFQGVHPAFLETLPLVLYSSSKKRGTNVDCVVCLNDFEEGEPLCQLPRCKHVFHKDCINMWLFSHRTCPLCRRTVTSDSTRSFRWGTASGSLRLSIGRRGTSDRSSTTVTDPSTPTESLRNTGDLTSLDCTQLNRIPRSHSTGHYLFKQPRSSMVRVPMAEHADFEGETSEEGGAAGSGGCLPLPPPAAFQRSRSYASAVGENVSGQLGRSSWMREAGATLKRALSIKRAGSAGATPTAPTSAATTISTSAISAAVPFQRMSEHPIW